MSENKHVASADDTRDPGFYIGRHRLVFNMVWSARHVGRHMFKVRVKGGAFR